MFEARPYRIIPKIQNYEWGTKNSKAFIPKFLGIKTSKNLPYAELWFGTHPKSPSEIIIDNKNYSLDEIVKKYPIEILGKEIAKKYSNSFPFLLKILSINKALSIQTHPNKKTAKILHKKDHKNYPDENHKPEIAIALDSLDAIVGLKEIKEIRKVFLKYPEIENLISPKILKQLYENSNGKVVKRLYSEIMNADLEKLKIVIFSLSKTISQKKEKNFIEQVFLEEYKNYGIDVGLISLFLFNHIKLKKNGAIFTPAGIPHAYLKGNIVECMANSDNVVRAGLTNKFKDIPTLTKILEINSDKTKVEKTKSRNKIIYKTAAEEFQVEHLSYNEKFSLNRFINSVPNILLVLKGKTEIQWLGNKKLTLKKGEACLIPASLKNYNIYSKNDSEIYRAIVPEL